MAASDYVPIFFKNRLHLAGRPQMSSRPSGSRRHRHVPTFSASNRNGFLDDISRDDVFLSKSLMPGAN